MKNVIIETPSGNVLVTEEEYNEKWKKVYGELK
jgi:hypothetical protein